MTDTEKGFLLGWILGMAVAVLMVLILMPT